MTEPCHSVRNPLVRVKPFHSRALERHFGGLVRTVIARESAPLFGLRARAMLYFQVESETCTT